MIALLIAASAMLLFAGQADADDEMLVFDVQGDALVRELGDYLWRRPANGLALYAGDRLRLRQGEIAVAFPQATLRILDEGEIEVPVELVDGFAEDWENDVELLNGSYTIDLNDLNKERPLMILTHSAQVETDGTAQVKMNVTVDGVSVTVLSGQVTIRHRITGAIKNASAGMNANISRTQMSVLKVAAQATGYNATPNNATPLKENASVFTAH
jgi:hypothetical protein